MKALSSTLDCFPPTMCRSVILAQAIQSFEIAGIEWDIDWKPRHVDLASLRAGSPAELLNLIPLQGVRFRLPPLKVYNLADWVR